jgi:multidrug resistance efflux pump
MSVTPADPEPTVEARKPWPLPPRRAPYIAAALILSVLAILAVLWAWGLPPFASGFQETDNAYVRGRTTIIAPQVSGYVTAVEAADYAHVTAGQVLVRIDDRQYHAAVDQAHAALDAQKAALANLDQAHASRVAALHAQIAGIDGARAQQLRANADLARAVDLVTDGSVSMRERDQLQAALAQADAQVKQSEATREIAREDIKTVDVSRQGLAAQIEAATAQLRSAEINLENTIVRAPEAGQLGEIGVRLGQYVTNGTQLLNLVPDERWVIANYKETQMLDMRPGQAAYVTVDALGGRRFDGHVEQVSPAAGSEFSVVKPDNGTGNFVKIPQRIGVRIALDHGDSSRDALRPGMSVEAHVDTQRAR